MKLFLSLINSFKLQLILQCHACLEQQKTAIISLAIMETCTMTYQSQLPHFKTHFFQPDTLPGNSSKSHRKVYDIVAPLPSSSPINNNYHRRTQSYGVNIMLNYY